MNGGLKARFHLRDSCGNRWVGPSALGLIICRPKPWPLAKAGIMPRRWRLRMSEWCCASQSRSARSGKVQTPDLSKRHIPGWSEGQRPGLISAYGTAIGIGHQDEWRAESQVSCPGSVREPIGRAYSPRINDLRTKTWVGGPGWYQYAPLCAQGVCGCWNWRNPCLGRTMCHCIAIRGHLIYSSQMPQTGPQSETIFVSFVCFCSVRFFHDSSRH